ncbi:hypothetical protein [Kineosphaera limosa]|nr:hypothetical protein [Kineosphaera limosa]
MASLYAPLGFERVVEAQPLESAPLRLARALRRRPSAMELISPPFVCASLDEGADRLTLLTDSVGVGRLFEVRTAWGWVWSNRPEAALSFAGLPARADEVGWAHIGVADELFGQVSAYEGVRVIDAATCLEWDGRAGRLSVSAVDTVSSWAVPDRAARSGELIEAAAQDLAGVAASVARLFDQRPVVDLTGGRDSRLVAAAFLAADADVCLHTHDALPGDLQVARELVGLLTSPPEHRVEHVATGGAGEPPPWEAMANARAWHRFAEGMRPFSYLHYPAPRSLDVAHPLAIGGAGGEVAHGYFYPAAREELERLPLEEMLGRFADSIVARYAPVAGADPQARALVREQILGTLRSIADRGYRDATVLDVFYLRERIRRWGSTGERTGVISPLLAPGFLRAALSLTPQERSANVLHRELTRRLVPQWADPPYYPAEYERMPAAARPAAPRVIRVGDAADRDAVNSLIHDRQAWAAAFDPALVDSLWAASVAGRTDARQERVLRAVVWRGAFEDHLDEWNDRPTDRPVVAWVPPPPPPSPPSPPTAPAAAAVDGAPRPRQVGAVSTEQAPPRSAVPLARRLSRGLAATRVWRRVRGTSMGAVLRSRGPGGAATWGAAVAVGPPGADGSSIAMRTFIDC